jgi:GDPmannose 4,6-dehydratase
MLRIEMMSSPYTSPTGSKSSPDPKRSCALITGVNGQDGSYLAELLLEQGYRVIGTVRPASRANLQRIAHIKDRIELFDLDLLDRPAMQRIIDEHRPSEIFNLAARASSTQLHADPALTAEYNGIAVAHLLESIRSLDPAIRFCQASSSEMFGNADRTPQNESTPFRPRNAYGAAKLYGHWMTVNYRETHGLFACSAILFNHESPRRGHEFVTRKVTRAAAKISAGQQERLELGSLNARRDWGFAGDYVRAMWLMLQAGSAGDYVVATGATHSVQDLCEVAFDKVGLDYRHYVVENPSAKRRADSTELVGDPSLARRRLGWSPSVSFVQLVEMMVDADVLESTTGESATKR